MSRQLAEVLLKDKLITQPQFDEAIKVAAASKEPPINGSPMRVLISKKLVSEAKLLDYLSKKYHLHSINLSKFEVDPKVIGLLSLDLAKTHQMVPIQARADTMVVAVCDPMRLAEIDKVKFATKLNVEAVLTSYTAFDESMAKYYGSSAVIASALDVFQKKPGQGGAPMTKKEAEKRKEEAADQGMGLELVEVHDIDQGVSAAEAADAPVITFVNGILGEAIRRNASDIHVEPYEKRFRVRLRVDGSLHEVAQVPLEMKRAVVARMKIMSRMDIAESRVPQDGRIKLKTRGKEVDFRVNTLPTLFGEKVVMRMLSTGNLQLDLQKLGFEAGQLAVFKKGIYAPNGMVLVTGPTGSGKTTTLYSALAELNQITDNISTAEDPVEYNLEGINQTQINKEVGLTFASVLRAMLRQDPDTILVGEIRDYETAEVSVQAALTGHLVLSTLHTNDAPSTITRLMNMGLEPFLVTSSVNTIVAQRLLRRVCPKCKEEQQIPLERLTEVGIPKEVAAKLQLFKGKGCQLCGGTGYKGRVAIYEVLDFTQELKEMVLQGSTVLEIRKAAIGQGMKTLRQSALSRVVDGSTSLEEALGATMEN